MIILAHAIRDQLRLNVYVRKLDYPRKRGGILECHWSESEKMKVSRAL